MLVSLEMMRKKLLLCSIRYSKYQQINIRFNLKNSISIAQHYIQVSHWYNFLPFLYQSGSVSLASEKMSSVPRHMTNDDSFPDLTPGLPRLYYMQYCPYALRARLMLTLKGVKFETININLLKKPKWFLDKFPSGTVPVFEVDDKLLGESLVIAEYVDEEYSEPEAHTLPMDPYQKAKERLLISNFFPKVISSIYKRLRKQADWRESLTEQFKDIEKILSKQKYFSGENFGYSDYMIWPWLRYINPCIIDDVLPGGDFPNLDHWLEEAKENPTIKKCHTPWNILAEFCKGYPDRSYRFDLE